MPEEQPQTPLRLVQHSLEEQLDQRVDAVSEAKPSRQESTAELIQLEETLSSAQEKAKQLVTLRLKLGEGKPGGPLGDSQASADGGSERGSDTPSAAPSDPPQPAPPQPTSAPTTER